MLSFAQDIIITRDAKRIESKIQEVSLTEVRYQTWNNLDGPVFVLPTSEISVITFQNGTVKVFDSAKSSADNNQGINSSELSFGTISRFGNMYSLRQNGRETQNKDVSLPQEESETDMMSEEKQDILALQERISQLEKSLEYERLRVSAYERLIEIVKQEDGIDVLKKDGAKQ